MVLPRLVVDEMFAGVRAPAGTESGPGFFTTAVRRCRELARSIGRSKPRRDHDPA